MRLFVVSALEVPDPTPAPNAPGSPESGFELPDCNKVAQAVDKALCVLPAGLAADGINLLNQTVVAVIPDPFGKSLVETWNTLIPLYMRVLLQQVPSMPGLLAVPVFPDPKDQSAAQVVSMRGPQSARDMIGYRVDLLSAMTHATHTVAKQTEQSLQPILDLARHIQKARDEAAAAGLAESAAAASGRAAAGVSEPAAPEIAGVG